MSLCQWKTMLYKKFIYHKGKIKVKIKREIVQWLFREIGPILNVHFFRVFFYTMQCWFEVFFCKFYYDALDVFYTNFLRYEEQYHTKKLDIFRSWRVKDKIKRQGAIKFLYKWAHFNVFHTMQYWFMQFFCPIYIRALDLGENI